MMELASDFVLLLAVLGTGSGYMFGPSRGHPEEVGRFDLFAFRRLQSCPEDVSYLRSAYGVIGLILILRTFGTRRDKAERR